MLFLGVIFLICTNSCGYSKKNTAKCIPQIAAGDSLMLSNSVKEITNNFGCYKVGGTTIHNGALTFIFKILEYDHGIVQPVLEKEMAVFNALSEDLRFENEITGICIGEFQSSCNVIDENLVLFLSTPRKNYVYGEIRSAVWDFKPVGETTSFLLKFKADGSIGHVFNSSVHYN